MSEQPPTGEGGNVVSLPTKKRGAASPEPPSNKPLVRGKKPFASMGDLLRDTSSRGKGVEELLSAKQINLDRIAPDPEQPRKSFPQESLEELAASIQTRGVLQPIRVRYDRTTDMYIVIDGERRWRASTLAGIPAMPAIVVDEAQSGGDRLIDQLMANIQREDLNAVERAEGLNRLKEAMSETMGNVTWDQVADAVGIKRSRLYQLRDLLDPAKVTDSERAAVQRGTLSEKHVRSVLRHLSGNKREAVQQAMEEDHLSVQEATDAAKALVANPHITDATPVAEIVEAVRRVRREARQPRPPEEWTSVRAAVAGASNLPTVGAAEVDEAAGLAARLGTLLVAMTDGSPSASGAATKRLRAAVRRLREAADLYLDSSQ